MVVDLRTDPFAPEARGVAWVFESTRVNDGDKIRGFFVPAPDFRDGEAFRALTAWQRQGRG